MLQVVADQVVVVLRVGDGGLEQLAPGLRDRARRVGEDGARLRDVLAADVVADQARLARGGADVAGLGADDRRARRRALARPRLRRRRGRRLLGGLGGLLVDARRLGARCRRPRRRASPWSACAVGVLAASASPFFLAGAFLAAGFFLSSAASSSAAGFFCGLPASFGGGLARLGPASWRRPSWQRGLGLAVFASSSGLPSFGAGGLVRGHRFLAFLASSPCPRYVRVGANSPSLWPTIDSRDEHGHVLAPVVDGDRVTDHLREDRRGPRPGLDHLLGVGLVHRLDAPHEALLDERALLGRTRH